MLLQTGENADRWAACLLRLQRVAALCSVGESSLFCLLRINDAEQRLMKELQELPKVSADGGNLLWL